MTSEQIVLMLQIGAFVLQLLILGIGGMWKLSRIEVSLREQIQANNKDTDRSIAEVWNKFRDFELEAQKTFLRREDFLHMIDGLKAEMKALRDWIDAQLQRFDAKLDRIDDHTK